MSQVLLPSTKVFLKETFASYQEAKNLWLAGGGKASSIIDTFDSNIRWGDLFRKIEAGAVDPLKLILAALREYPLNKLLLLELKNQISEEDFASGQNFVNSPTASTMLPLSSITEEQATAAVTLGVVEAISPNILESSNDTATNAFKQSFAQKAGEALAIAGGAAWYQILHTMIGSF